MLVEDNETSIYENSNSKKIKDAQKKVDNEHTLMDILLKEYNFKTINYYSTINKYVELTKLSSEKVKKVLFNLSDIRNAITHFGIEILDYDEIVSTFINTFDVIYNYLRDSFETIDDIGDYFTEDDLIVKTIHGNEWFVAEDGTYTGILDYLDELLTDHNEYIFSLRANNQSFLIEYPKLKNKYGLVNSQFELKECPLCNSKLELIIEENQEFYVCSNYLKGNCKYKVIKE